MSQQGQLRKLVVAVDASPNAARAGNEAVMLAEKFNAELIALHAVPIPSYTFAQAEVGSVAPSMFQEYYEAAQKEGKLAVDEVVTSAKAKNVKATGVVLGPAVSIVETIIDYGAKNNVDLIVVGTRGRTGFKKLLLGSVSTGVLAHADCSVLVVR
jgi:nucleotide-binding universal stress UspA family protein